MNETSEIVSGFQQVREWLCVTLPLTDYRKAWDLQLRLVKARVEGSIGDTVLCLEHPPVFTLGRRGKRENLRVTDEFLEKEGIPVIPVERGGDITYHGPGQIVVYPIINLERAGLDVGSYIDLLEEVMIRTAVLRGVTAERNSLNRGIWVGERKMGSIGISVRRGITYHGVALNVNTSLEPFEWIHPCGLSGVSMTSMERELSRKLDMDMVRDDLMRIIETVFGVRLVDLSASELRTRIEESDN